MPCKEMIEVKGSRSTKKAISYGVDENSRDFTILAHGFSESRGR